VPLKQTPADRRALGSAHTTDWIKNRRTGWADHQGQLDEDKAKRQRVADNFTRARGENWDDYNAARQRVNDNYTRARQENWSDYNAQEASRTAVRDMYPSQLDFAKQRLHEERENRDMATEQYRQGILDEASHPPALQAAREQAEGARAQQQAAIEALAHPPHLQAAREAREAAMQKQYAALAEALNKVGPHGYTHGWHYVGGPGLAPPRSPYAASTSPGSFEHLNAMEELGRQAAASTGDPEHMSPTMAAALHNMARAVARRDMDSARTHLAAARSANRTEAGGKWSHELNDLGRQLGSVPPGATGWENRQELNPLSPEAQHPGTYLPTRDVLPGGVPADPTQGAMAEFASEPTELRRAHPALAAALSKVLGG
jgi:hypothetical protein